MKVNELFELWLNKYVKHKIKLRTFLTYQSIINNHICPILGNYELNNLNFTIIQDFICFKIEKGNLINQQKLSYNSVNLIISVLKQGLKCAYNLELILTDLTSKISYPKCVEKRINIFSLEEQQILEKYCLTKKNKYIGIVLCLYTGLRIGELLALTWDDFNFDKQLLFVNKNLSILKINGKNIIHIDEPKTESSYRVIPIPKQLIPF